MAKTWHITDILTVPAVDAHHEDPPAPQAQPRSRYDAYRATPVAPGFGPVQELAGTVSVGLVLNDRAVSWGDCVAVCHSGKARRRYPAFGTEEGLITIRSAVTPALKDREVTSFRELAAEVDALVESVEPSEPLPQAEAEPRRREWSRRDFLTLALARETPRGQKVATERVTVERPLHTAIRYGVSQALLKAVALARDTTMAEVIAEEWNLPPPDEPVPIHAQCGADRYAGADEMIIHRVASLAHTLADGVPEQLPEGGTKLIEYVRWLKQRIQQLSGADYRPTIHLHVQGALGHLFDNNLGRVLGHLYSLDTAAQPYPLRVESPVIMESREAQIEALKTLRDYVRFRKMNTQLVVDEWADTLKDIKAFIEGQAADMIRIKMPDLGSVHNSVDAVLACKAGGVGTLLNGRCSETDLPGRVTTHVALATRPDIVMAKHISRVQNEMNRTLAEIQVAALRGS